MPDDGRDARRLGPHDHRQAPEVQAARPLLGGAGEADQLIRSVSVVGPIVLVGCLLGCLSGCGEGFGREAAIESFAAANPETTEDQAACVVDGLVETYGLDRLEDELATEPLGADFEEAQFRQMFACDVEGDWRAQVTDQLVANGVAAADAPCVSDELWATMTADDVDVLLSGEITDAFAGRFYDALDACGALNPDQNRGQGE